MILEKNNIYNGFKLQETKYINELNSEAMIFIHEKTGAKLFKLQNSDDNKVFSIGFRTPPKDSTGVAHIIEHSVLCGSEKYRSKEPFVELLKGSLNTFLNAMTFPDKTIYPVASRNSKDFHNLINVYLDAVLHPLIYNEPLIFMQEGWHYELNSPEAELIINGVVYNEMKGVYSSPDSLLYRYIPSSLMPNTTYGVDSGGDPDEIPNLTYEGFVNFHKRYYHPSNSYIFLYGDGEVTEELKLIDNYLKDYEKISPDSEIYTQKPFNEMKEIVIPYTISKEEEDKDKTYLSLNFSIGTSMDAELSLAFQVLTYMLIQNPAAPLKKALIEAEIGKSVNGDYDSSSKQPVLSIIVKNSEEENKEKFQQVVFDTLKALVDNGIDKELIEASINFQEFLLRESDFRGYPKGLVYYMGAMESWLHDESPLLHLEYDNHINKIKQALTTNYFEELIDKYILKNNHSSLVILKPEKGLGEKKAKDLEKKLKDYKSSLNSKEIEKIISNTKRLRERQQSQDSEEVLHSIPQLALSDIDKKAEWLPIEELQLQNTKVLFHDVFTNKIAYLNFIFDTSNVPEELVPYIRLLGDLLSKLSTDKYSYESLSNKININTGGINFVVNTSSNKDNTEDFKPMLTVKSKALIEKLPELSNLIGEIIKNTKFSEKSKILSLIREQKARMESLIYNSGHSIASLKVLSYLTPKGIYDETVRGLSYYRFLCTLEENYNDEYEVLINNLAKVKELVFNLNNLTISYTCEKEYYNRLEEALNVVSQYLNCDKVYKVSYNYGVGKKNEGLTTEAKVQYVAKGFNYKELGFEYNGALRVIENILTLDYLWNKVRVMGGAYGVNVNVLKDGSVYISSYRDPKLAETINAYDNIFNYLKDFKGGEREIVKYILGTISRLDFPLTPSMISDISDSRYFAGITYEDIQKERDEILSLNSETVQSFSSLFKMGMEENYICVLGNEEKIQSNKSIFENITKVF